MPMKCELYVTLWPTFPHYKRFATDDRLAGIRLNSAMIHAYELDTELEKAKTVENAVPLFFDIKGKQLRVTGVIPYPDHLEITLNHPITVQTPVPVLFKGGEDHALCIKVMDKKHLVFEGGPGYNVYEGESIHIRHPSLDVQGPVLLDFEIEKINKAKQAGIDRWCLSYVEKASDIDEFREHIGDDLVVLKIENKKGLDFVAGEFKKQPNLDLMAACGDLYVEIDKPHHIMAALKLISSKDPEAFAGSRMLLSLIAKPVPKCADLLQLAWLYDTGYHRMMLCDEICLKEELLASAVNVFDAFRGEYVL
ncbi:MAG: hypothetical protein JXB88_10720 [Spirochaetales bacterium]|nr:hypothetical protein [Spirochaetales bacterium]